MWNDKNESLTYVCLREYRRVIENRDYINMVHENVAKKSGDGKQEK